MVNIHTSSRTTFRKDTNTSSNTHRSTFIVTGAASFLTVMGTSTSAVIISLAAISAFAVYIIFLIPPSSVDLFPQSILAYDKGAYPDGLSLRKHYTGISLLDRVFTAYGGFFALVVDGRDPATWLFCVWFLPQLCGVLVFCYWEAGRVNKGGFASR